MFGEQSLKIPFDKGMFAALLQNALLCVRVILPDACCEDKIFT